MGLDIKSTTIFKGGLSILIVLHHLQYEVSIPYFNVFKHFGAPAVSIFFFLSGYGLMSSYIKKGNSYLDNFWGKRFGKILLPFVITTLLYLSLDYFDKGVCNVNLWNDLIYKGYTPLPYSWFVFTILLFYIGFYFVFILKNITTRGKLIFLFCLTFLYILVVKEILEYDRAWWVSVLAFPVGLLYKFRESTINILRNTLFRRFLGIVVVSVVCAVFILLKIELLYALVYMLIPVIVVLLMQLGTIPKSKFLMYLGNISYEIYLLHGIWIYLLRGKNIYIASDYIYVVLVLVVTIVSGSILHLILNKRNTSS